MAGRSRGWPSLPFQRLQQRRFLAANIGRPRRGGYKCPGCSWCPEYFCPIARRHMPRPMAFCRVLAGLIEFAAQINIGRARLHGVTAQHHAFDHLMRVILDELVILKGAGFALIARSPPHTWGRYPWAESSTSHPPGSLAPPRPRNPASLTTPITSSGFIPLSALRQAA